jgi:hypothetical protein
MSPQRRAEYRRFGFACRQLAGQRNHLSSIYHLPNSGEKNSDMQKNRT